MNPCCSCRHPTELLLDFGPQPVCNRLLAEPTAAEVQHPLRLGQCPACGLLQLVEPITAAALRPAKPIRYNEPERHLDHIADRIAALPGVSCEANICGLTYKEASLISRLRQRGFQNARCLDMRRDWGLQDPAAGVETIQEQTSAGVLSGHADHRAKYQVVVARHILEHAHNLEGFIAGLRGALAADGYLIFEVPDFTASLRGGNYSTLWEEHVVYFTNTTFPAVLQRLGLQVREVLTYPSALEDLLVGVTQVATRAGDAGPNEAAIGQQVAEGRRYASRLPAVRDAWSRALAGEHAAGRQVALLGAGHLGIMFLNLLELHHAVDFAVDDDPEKCGWYLPGSRLPVFASDVLYTRPVRLCLMSVAPESEDKVRQRLCRFVEAGGRLVSIFPDRVETVEERSDGLR